ncbi:MAG TPA: hypothetical protein VIF09_07410 [Polyangiaceae bacterium]|jgi:hypothetical protein
MRPSLVLGLVAAAVTVVVSASADPSAPAPQINFTGTAITVTATGATHVNSGFPWYYLPAGSTTKVKSFTFSGGTSDSPQAASVSGLPGSGTLRGAYCATGNCYTFTASCTASGASSACTITGT